MRGSLRISRYVLGELAGPTLLGVSVYGFILLMNAFLLVARVALSKDLGWVTILKLFLFEVPTLLVLAIPMATILGVLVSFGRLSSDHEATAIQAAGLGPRVLVGPVLIHGVALGLISFGIYAVVVPETAYASRKLNAQVLLSGGMGTNLSARVFYGDIPGYVLFAREIHPGSQGTLEGLFVHQERGEGGRTFTFLAREGNLYRASDGSQRVIADLRDGVCHVYRTDHPESYRFFGYDRYQVPIEPPAYYKTLSEPPKRSPQNQALPDLFPELRQARLIREPPLREARTRALEIEIHQRVALPFACVVFALLGVPMGLTRARSGKGAGFALSIAVTLVYWIVFTSLRDQASHGRIPPFWGVWSANLVVVGWAVWAYLGLRPSARDESFLQSLGAKIAGRAAALASRLPGAARSLPPPPAAESEAAPPRPAATRSGWCGETARPRRLLKLVDRHIATYFLRFFAYSTLSAYAIFVVVELKQILDSMLRFDRPVGMLFEYFKYFAPGKLGLILPVSCLVAAIVTFTLLGRSGELTALKASGTSMRRATLPVLAVTLALCAVAFFVGDQLAPVTNQRALAVRDRIQGKPPRTYGMPAGGRWTFGASGRLYHYRLYDPDRKIFQGLSVFTADPGNPRIAEHRFATLARWDGRRWVLEKGWRRTFPSDGSVGEFETYASGEIAPLDPPENFDRREATISFGNDLPDQMSVAELGDQVSTLRTGGYDTSRLEVAFHAKIAQPLTPFVMVLLGLPFAFQVGRRGSLYGIGVALLLVIVYWAFYAVFNALGFETVLPPVLAAWAPNVLFGLLGAYLLLYVRT